MQSRKTYTYMCMCLLLWSATGLSCPFKTQILPTSPSGEARGSSYCLQHAYPSFCPSSEELAAASSPPCLPLFLSLSSPLPFSLFFHNLLNKLWTQTLSVWHVYLSLTCWGPVVAMPWHQVTHCSSSWDWPSPIWDPPPLREPHCCLFKL